MTSALTWRVPRHDYREACPTRPPFLAQLAPVSTGLPHARRGCGYTTDRLA